MQNNFIKTSLHLIFPQKHLFSEVTIFPNKNDWIKIGVQHIQQWINSVKSRVVSDSATPWTAAHQASLSITNSQSLLKFTSIELVMPSNHLILCWPLLLLPSIFPSIRVFLNESVLHIRWPKYWSFSFNISPSKNIQDWFPLGWTCWISSQSKGLSRAFSNTTVQKHQLFGVHFLYSPTLTSIHYYWRNHSSD